MLRTKLLLPACCISIVCLFTAPSVGALNLNRTMYLTFSRSVQLPGVTLAPGTYIFELAEPTSANNLVRVLSHDRRNVYLLAFTLRVDRPRGMRSDQFVSIGEAPGGAPPPITVWYPRDDSTGRQFIYSGR